ncbi:MAG: group 1 truncated hemoglobin [Flavobacteriaceae bacterium]
MANTLFERLGGSTGIAAIVDDTVDAHMRNTAVNARFLPFLEQPERLVMIKQHTIAFLGMGRVGPQIYNGKDMVTAHNVMNISQLQVIVTHNKQIDIFND